MPAPPSGRQHELTLGDQRVVVVEVGGGLRTYSAGDWDLLDGYREDEMAASGRGQPLVPWPNRIRDGRYRFGGSDLQLALSEPASHNACHGLVRFANWIAAERSQRRLVMEHRLHPQPGYPFSLSLSLAYGLSEAGLEVTMAARNDGAAPCPFGAGMHPYFGVGTTTVDEVTLCVPAARRLLTDDRGIPTGEEPVEGTEYDFRAARPLRTLELDTPYTGLECDADGRARVTLASPGGERRLAVWLGEGFDHVMVFSGDTLPEDRRRRGLAVEPMTCPPNAFATGNGVRVLAPGESFSAAWGIAPDRTSV